MFTKTLMQCKSVCDVKSGKDPPPDSNWSEVLMESEWVRCHYRFDESTMGKDSSVPLMLRDPSDLG